MADNTPPAPPPWAGRTLSPMLRQYVEAKQENPDVILLFRMGDFFELFFDDAKLVAELLDLTLTARDKGDNPVPMAGVPHHAVEGYVARLVAQGYSVALCDQIEDPKAQKGLVKRAITRLITPGTICELDALDPGQTSFLAAAVPVETNEQNSPQTGELALAFLDVLAGELAVTLVPAAEAAEELLRMGAREVLADQAIADPLTATLRRGGVALRPDWAQRRRERPQGAATEATDVAALPPAPPLPRALGADPGTDAQRAALRRATQEVLAWARHTQRQALRHVAAPKFYRRDEAMVMDEATRQNLELVCTQMDRRRQGSLLAHLDVTRTPMGSRLLRRWLLAPLRTEATIARRADVVESLVDAPEARETLRSALREVRDVERLAGRVAVGRATPRDVAALSCSLAQLPAIAACAAALPAPQGAVLAEAWGRAPMLAELVGRAQAGLVEQPPSHAQEGGIFVRGYDAALDELITLTEDADGWLAAFEERERARTGIAGLKVRYNRVFGYNLEVSRAQQKPLPDDYVRRQTLANAERYVTEELKAFETRALSAAAERKAHEASLFAALVRRFADALAQLKAISRLLAQTDALVALAHVAARHRYVRPRLTAAPQLALKGSRHPVLETLLPHGERFVANDVACAADSDRLIVLTGPNMAGKSTLMRQVALSVVMAQMGGFVPAERAEVGLCDRLFVRVGASDNLSRGQSTFMVEMVETATILRQATSASLVLLDEIGRGTSTFDGLSIAWAVAEYLHNQVGCRTLFATHYHELVALTEQLAHACAMQVTVHEQDGQLVFLRQLRRGAAMRSYGIEVARLAHLPAPVLARAREVLAALEASGAQGAEGGCAEAPQPVDGGGRAGGPPLPRMPSRRQLSLFAAGAEASAPTTASAAGGDADPVAGNRATDAPAPRAARAAAQKLRRALLNYDLERMTPLQALVALQRLQRRAAQMGRKRSAGGQTGGRARMHQAQLLP